MRLALVVAGVMGSLLAAGGQAQNAPTENPPVQNVSAAVQDAPVDVWALAPAAPDYANPESWAALPSKKTVALTVPVGASPLAENPQVDVFFVHPTTFRTQTAYSQDVADAEANRWTDASITARQASVFNGSAAVYAPRYRQASFLTFRTEATRLQAFALAYGDVERAFDYYLTHHNKGRPFILAGHSQGAAHLAELLEKRIDGQEISHRMVAAYIIGINLMEGEFGTRYKQLQPCRTATQTGCVLQWNAVDAGADIQAMADRYKAMFAARYGADAPGNQPLCINPVSFDQKKPATKAKQARGAVPGEPGEGEVRPLVAQAVEARCTQGLLAVRLAKPLDFAVPATGSLHYHDIGLFYQDVRDNLRRRVSAFTKR